MCNSNDGVKKTKITVSSGDDLLDYPKSVKSIVITLLYQVLVMEK